MGTTRAGGLERDAGAAFLAALVLLCLCGPAAGQQGAADAPSPPAGSAREGAEALPVVRVNGVPITMGAVVREMSRLQQRQPADGGSAAAVKEAALRRLILQELAVQRAKSLGITVGAEEVDAEQAAFKAAMGGEEKLAAFLGRESLSAEQLRVRLERDLLVRRVLAREVTADTAPGEEELRATYDRRSAAFAVPEKVTVTDVLFFLDPGSAAERRRAEAVRERLAGEAGGNPDALTSDGSFLVRTLDLKEADDPELYAAARRLAQGNLSPVLAAGGSLHIVRLDAYAPGRQRPFEEVRPQLERAVRARKERAALEAWEARLRSGAVIEDLEPAEHRP